MALSQELTALRGVARNANFKTEIGAIKDVTASRIVTTLRNVFVGERCILRDPSSNTRILAQVVAIENGQAILSPFEEVDGLSAGTEVLSTGEPHQIMVGENLVGRVLDGLGRPMDREPLDLAGMVAAKLTPPQNDPLNRPIIDEVFETGVKSVDAFNTVGQGQRMAIFGEAGAGKSTLLAMLARHGEADVVVLAMIGERGREVREFLDRQMTQEVREKTIVVASTSDRPAMERIMAAHTAVTISEHFRAQGKRVLLLFDSVTRFARALREVGLSAGEKAVRRGFTPSVYAELPRLIERSGKTAEGAITAFFTVLVENDGVNDPVAEEVASLTDGHLVLDAELARSGIYPAINVLKSKSRLMNEIVHPDQTQSANHLRKLMAKYQDMELLIQVGEYVPGTDTVADEAIAVHPHLNVFVGQGTHDFSGYNDTCARMHALADGVYEDEAEFDEETDWQDEAEWSEPEAYERAS